MVSIEERQEALERVLRSTTYMQRCDVTRGVQPTPCQPVTGNETIREPHKDSRPPTPIVQSTQCKPPTQTNQPIEV